ncbi:MAG: DUF3108 domain-containing protein [Nitrospirae bacterium]|nr:DUF3108 domain-containing protein [Nitrospirota bacterium]MBI3595014.1 DUF3108 domain-containing protein [Nitrospirota bacterium]
MFRKINTIAITFFLFLSLLAVQISGADSAHSSINFPGVRPVQVIQSGERLEFSVNWMGMNAGSAILEVGQEVEIGASRAFHIMSTARSNDFISRFFPVEDRIETFVDAENLLPLKFMIHQREGRRFKEREVHYDQTNHKVLQLEEGREETFKIEPNTQDALSALYFFRTLEMPAPGGSAIIKVHEGGKNWDLEVKVLGKEAIDTPVGQFNTVKTLVMARYEGVFMNKGDITVWFTDDDRRVPVQMQSKVAIGMIKALLVSKDDGN